MNKLTKQLLEGDSLTYAKWTRKPATLRDVHTTVPMDSVPPGLHIFDVGSLDDPLGQDFPADQTYYLLDVDNGDTFLVKSEGYSYPRYVSKVV